MLLLVLDNYVSSDICDDGRTASTVQLDTPREYQRFLPPVGRTRVSLEQLSGVVWRVVNSMYHSSVEYSQMGICQNLIIFWTMWLAYLVLYNERSVVACSVPNNTLTEEILPCIIHMSAYAAYDMALKATPHKFINVKLRLCQTWIACLCRGVLRGEPAPPKLSNHRSRMFETSQPLTLCDVWKYRMTFGGWCNWERWHRQWWWKMSSENTRPL